MIIKLNSVKQRIYQNAAGYHTDNDAKLNKDFLASQPTISRANTKLNKEHMKQLQKANYKIFDKIHNFEPPKKMIFDLDSTSFKTYGQQHGAKNNSHYGTNGYHPLLMFDGVTGDLIKVKLRSGNVYTSRKAVRFIGPIFILHCIIKCT